MHWVRNVGAAFGAPIPATYAETLGRVGALEARRYFEELFGYQPTPMPSLAGLAAALGVARIHYKDEGYRLGLQSFKALGGAYAVARVVHRHLEKALGRKVSLAEMASGAVRRQAAALTVACATDGNHGRSVAWGAQRLGCSCVIFLHEHVSKLREDAIAAFGARIVRVPGVYDDSCVEATRISRREGWQVVSDFATEPYHEVTSWVMQGYGVMVDEILGALETRGEKLTHVFVQGGCGGLAAAVAGHCALRLPERPTVVVVEPERANCLLESARKGGIVRIGDSRPTCMSMLECYEPSHMAWPILERTSAVFMDIPDEAAVEASRRLAAPGGGDPVLRAGASGAAGVAGLVAASEDTEARKAAGLDAESCVLVIGSEGLIE
jgi:diaminopropionate ammonia-lyase